MTENTEQTMQIIEDTIKRWESNQGPKDDPLASEIILQVVQKMRGRHGVKLTVAHLRDVLSEISGEAALLSKLLKSQV